MSWAKKGAGNAHCLLCESFSEKGGVNVFFFDKNKRYSFIQIDKVHRYNTNPNSLKTKRMNK